MSQKSVAKNSLFFFVAQLTTAILSFTSSILIARTFGPYVTGQYNYLVWIGSLLVAISTLGIPNALTKFVAEHSEFKNERTAQKISGNLLVISFLLGLISAGLLCLLTVFKVLPTDIKSFYFYLIAIALPFNIAAATFVGIFKGNRRYASLMKASIISTPLIFMVIVTIVLKRDTLTGLAVYYIISALILLVSYALAARRSLKLLVGKLPASIYRPIVKYIFVVSGVLLLDQIVWDKSEVLFLGHYAHPQQVAFYSLSYLLTNSVMTLIPGSIIGALLPHIASLQKLENIKAIANSYQSAIKYVSIIVGALIGGGIALAAPLILALYGNEYSQMTVVFRVLMFSAGWAIIVGVASTVLYGMTRQTILLKIGAALSILNITLDFLVIPTHGALGAAIVNSTTQFVGGVCTIYLLSKHTKLIFPTTTFIKICSISLASCLTVLALVRMFKVAAILSVLIFGIIFVLLYTFLLVVTKTITKSEVLSLRREVS